MTEQREVHSLGEIGTKDLKRYLAIETAESAARMAMEEQLPFWRFMFLVWVLREKDKVKRR